MPRGVVGCDLTSSQGLEYSHVDITEYSIDEIEPEVFDALIWLFREFCMLVPHL